MWWCRYNSFCLAWWIKKYLYGQTTLWFLCDRWELGCKNKILTPIVWPSVSTHRILVFPSSMISPSFIVTSAWNCRKKGGNLSLKHSFRYYEMEFSCIKALLFYLIHSAISKTATLNSGRIEKNRQGSGCQPQSAIRRKPVPPDQFSASDCPESS